VVSGVVKKPRPLVEKRYERGGDENRREKVESDKISKERIKCDEDKIR
jgi:hypothetical protein